MAIYFQLYVAIGVVFLALDAVWLTVMGKWLYRPLLGGLLQEPFHLLPAALFYLIYIAGIVVFAGQPALVSGRWTTALVYGAGLGFLAYATYDLTNQATLKNWPVLITLADLAWGTVVTAASATLGFLIVRAISRMLNG